MSVNYAGNTGVPFRQEIHIAHGGTGDGKSASNPLPFTDADLMAIPAKTVITNIFVVITTGITGVTNLDVGDDDNPDGFIDGSLSIADLSVAGMYSYDAKLAGAYLRVETAGATDAADIYVVPTAKYYSATGKEIKLDVTTASTAGACVVVVEGYRLQG